MCVYFTFEGKRRSLCHRDKLHGNRKKKKKVNSLLILCQVIVHHHHNLLIWDAILVDDLISMAGIGLVEGKQHWMKV